MKKTVHIISHTHWDREWYQTYQQFRIRLVHLVDNLLAILRDDPTFSYFMLDGQTIILEDYLEIRPEMEQELREHIHNGRILIGPWFILPDEFLVSPEATIRNLLKGRQDCRKWGSEMKVGYAPDTFGHISQLPQILRGFDFDTACLWRGLDDQPCELRWLAPDGSSVFLAYMRNGYGNGSGLPVEYPRDFVKTLNLLLDNLIPNVASSHMLVMLGTDHMEPTPGLSKAIQLANDNLENYHVIHSNLHDYIRAIKQTQIESKLPVIIGELRSSKRSHLLPGVLSTRMWIKQRNRSCENLLERWVEPYSTWASLISQDAYYPHLRYQENERVTKPAGLLHHAWGILMQNHPHDSICGCSIDQVHEEMRNRFDQVDQIGEEVLRQSLAVLNTSVDTAKIPQAVGEAFGSIVVYNAASSPQSGLVKTSLVLPEDIDHFELVDRDGKVIPYRLGDRGDSNDLFNATFSAVDFKNIIFLVRDGKAANLTIKDLQITQHEHQVELRMVMTERDVLDTEIWNQRFEEVQALLEDPTITAYHIIARSDVIYPIEFLAHHVPAIGYDTYWLTRTSFPSQKPLKINWITQKFLPLAARLSQSPMMQRIIGWKQATRPPFTIENEFMKVEASERDGSLTLTWKETNEKYIGLNRFIDSADCGDEYNYSPPIKDDIITDVSLTNVAIHKNDTKQVIILDLVMEVPKSLAEDRNERSQTKVKIPIQTEIILGNGSRQVDIHTVVDNTAQDHRLRVHFPVDFLVCHACYDGHFEIVKRPLGVPEWDETWSEQPRPEVPQRAFTAVQNDKQGLMIANRGLPEVEVIEHGSNGSEIALTLMRCVGWLSRDDFSTRKNHAGPYLPTPGAQMVGKYEFDYTLIPYSSGEDNFIKACHLAYAFQTPLRAVNDAIHPGKLPTRTSMIRVDSEKFSITAIKTSEEPSPQGQYRWIVRGYNLTNTPLTLNMIPWEKPASAELVNLAEIPASELVLAEDGSVTIEVGPHQIKTLQWTFNG